MLGGNVEIVLEVLRMLGVLKRSVVSADETLLVACPEETATELVESTAPLPIAVAPALTLVSCPPEMLPPALDAAVVAAVFSLENLFFSHPVGGRGAQVFLVWEPAWIGPG